MGYNFFFDGDFGGHGGQYIKTDKIARPMRRSFLSLVFLCLASVAKASCGSSSCPMDMADHAAPSGGRGRLDLSYQLITQDRLLVGSKPSSVGDDPNSEHNEIKTINRIYLAHLDYDFDEHWGAGLAMPLVSRTHDHHAAATGGIEHWGFTGLGDLIATGRYTVSGVTFSLGEKLPTGRTHAHNADEQAEVTIQPGTGSYDTILGLGYARALFGVPAFVGGTYRVNTAGSRGYRFANELLLNAGFSYPVVSRLDLLGQANLRAKGKDAAGQTQEDTSFTGGLWVYLSPGARVKLADSLSAYGYVQLPVYQYVNREQLVSSWNLLSGLSFAFGGQPEGF